MSDPKWNPMEHLGEEAEPNICVWTYSNDDDDYWATNCGNAYSFIDGGPKENSMKFCCYCGKKLKSQIGNHKS